MWSFSSFKVFQKPKIWWRIVSSFISDFRAWIFGSWVICRNGSWQLLLWGSPDKVIVSNVLEDNLSHGSVKFLLSLEGIALPVTFPVVESGSALINFFFKDTIVLFPLLKFRFFSILSKKDWIRYLFGILMINSVIIPVLGISFLEIKLFFEFDTVPKKR